MNKTKLLIVSVSSCFLALMLWRFFSSDQATRLSQITNKNEKTSEKNESVGSTKTVTNHAALTSLKTSKKTHTTYVSATSTIDPPLEPVWKLLETYRGKNPRSEQDDIEIVSALSYCINTANASQVTRDAVSKGENQELVEALKDQMEQRVKVCTRLNAADYKLRRSIVGARAEHGDVSAMLAFSYVGPGGKWLTPGESPISNEEKNSWESEAKKHLQNAASKGSVSALQALSDLHLGPDGVPCAEGAPPEGVNAQTTALIAKQNAILSLAYMYAYQSAVNFNDKSKQLFSSRVVSQYEVCLSESEKQKAKETAGMIFQRCCQ